MALDLRPGVDEALEAFGVPAVVTRPAPDTAPISTTAIWLPPLEESQPVGSDWIKEDPRRRLALPRRDVPQANNGTVITAAETLGGATRTWRKDGDERSIDAEWLHVLVVLVS